MPTVAQPKPLFAEEKAHYVRAMFAAIAPRYDQLNTLLSFRRHHAWRRYAVRLAQVANGERCLDVCTGTGDFALELARAVGPGGQVVGVDFCMPMLQQGLKKIVKRGGLSPIRFQVADALRLPYGNGLFDVVTVGFGIRNVAHLEQALAEMVRVTRPGGRVVLLEFTRPRPGLLRPLIQWYLFGVLPHVGGWLSRKEAYTYLPTSIAEFLTYEELKAVMERVGLQRVQVRALNFGTVCIHLGFVPAAAGEDIL